MAPQTNEKRSFSTAELTKLVNKANLHLLIHGKGKRLCFGSFSIGIDAFIRYLVYDLHEFVNEVRHAFMFFSTADRATF